MLHLKRNGKKRELTNINATLSFIADNNENKVRNITISPDFLQSPEEFIKRINLILSGGLEGSDPIFYKDLVTPVYNNVT